MCYVYRMLSRGSLSRTVSQSTRDIACPSLLIISLELSPLKYFVPRISFFMPMLPVLLELCKVSSISVHREEFTISVHREEFTISVHREEFTISVHREEFTISVHREELHLQDILTNGRTYARVIPINH